MTDKYPFAAMEIGDTFFIPGRATSNIEGISRPVRKRTGHVFTAWIEQGGVRVMRIDPELKKRFAGRALAAHCKALLRHQGQTQEPPAPIRGTHLRRCVICDGRFIAGPKATVCEDCLEDGHGPTTAPAHFTTAMPNHQGRNLR